jgi:hypothetical protein
VEQPSARTDNKPSTKRFNSFKVFQPFKRFEPYEQLQSSTRLLFGLLPGLQAAMLFSIG